MLWRKEKGEMSILNVCKAIFESHCKLRMEEEIGESSDQLPTKKLCMRTCGKLLAVIVA